MEGCFRLAGGPWCARLGLLAGSIAFLGAVATTRPAMAVSVFGSNLIVNGDAEAGAGSNEGNQVTVPDWTTTSTFTAVQYGASGGFPSPTDPGPTNRGNNFFAGGPGGALSTAMQTIDVSSGASTIDLGNTKFTLSGFLGGFADQRDNAVLSITFRASNDTSLGTASIGPVSNTDRNNLTGLLFRSDDGTVPTGTRLIDVTLTDTRLDGSYNDGYADNLSLILGAGTQPPPPGVPLPAAAWMGLIGLGGVAALRTLASRRRIRSI